MKTLKVGVIGYGFMGKMHASIYDQLPQTKLAAICDVDPTRFIDSSIPGVQYYTDFKDLINHPDIDAVSICVSDRDHFSPAIFASHAVKDIFS